MTWHMGHRHTGATSFTGDKSKKALWYQTIESAKEKAIKVPQFLVKLLATGFSL